MRSAPRPILVVLVLVGNVLGGACAGEVGAQRPPPAPSQPSGAYERESLDERLLRGIYTLDAPAFRTSMRAADASAYPVFLGAPMVVWGGTWLLRGGDDWAEAYRLTVSQVVTYGAVIGLKEIVRRSRPYVVLTDVHARASYELPLGSEDDSFAFPSGHAAMSFAIVTSLSLSHPKWYVIGPGAAWATAVSMSRVWLGVHYPSDVVAGAVLGTALAFGVHLAGPSITPGFLKENGTPAMRLQVAGSGMRLQVRF